MTIANLAVVQVIAHDAPWRVLVAFKSSVQGPAFPVQIGRDYADALRVSQRPLPGIGTWGIVAFPYNDIRNGIWLCSYLPSQMDALTSTLNASGSAPPVDPHIDYEAHFSGYWSLLDGYGNFASQFPDGSYFIAASGNTLPTLYRHTVVANVQQKVEFTRADRIPSPPNAYQMRLHHQSGTDLQIDVSGSVTVSGAAVSGASGATLTAMFGGSTVTIDLSGSVTVSGSTKASLTLKFGHTTLSVDSSGLTTLALPGSETFNITQGGVGANDWLVLVSKLVTWINNHKHSGVTTGGGQTGTVVTPMVSGDVNSTIVKISN